MILYRQHILVLNNSGSTVGISYTAFFGSRLNTDNLLEAPLPEGHVYVDASQKCVKKEKSIESRKR